jgi:H+/Cl- antiporter ClcA
MLKLANYQNLSPTMLTIPMAAIIGGICGLLGTLFVIINTYANMFRKIFLTNDYVRPIETIFLTFTTVTFWFWTPYLYGATCKTTENLFEHCLSMTV